MNEDPPPWTADSAKTDFLSGALWAAVVGKTASKPDATLDGLCVDLHNSGEIDFLAGIDQPEFVALQGYKRWQALEFIGRVIPRLSSTWPEMADFVSRAIAMLAGGNVYEIHKPFLEWLGANPTEAAAAVALAERGETPEPWLLERALTALADPDLCRRVARDYLDDRRLSAVRALARLEHPTPGDRLASLSLGQFLIDGSTDEDLAAAVALLVLDGLTRPDPALGDDAIRLLDEALSQGGAPGLAQAGFSFCTAGAEVLQPRVVAVLLKHLSNVTAEQTNALGHLVHGLGKLSRWNRSEEAFDFIRTVVTGAPGGLTVEVFEDAFADVLMGSPEAIHPLVLSWLEEGRPELCDGLVDLFQAFERASSPLAIDFTAHSYTDQQVWFICRRAIGYFLIHEVVAASVVVSALRSASPDLAEALTDLLTDPLLMNYQVELRPYLEAIDKEDPAHPFVRLAIERSDAYRHGVGAWDIPELQPSQAHLQLAQIRRSDEFARISREGRKRSVLADLVSTQTLLYGNRSLSYRMGPDGKRQMFETPMASFGFSSEMPHQDVLDPVSLAMQNYQLRHGEPR